MQVTHNHDYDTHAVIGGKEVMAFGIAESAEMFTMLFSALYSDKPLAVCREVLCNAWDAHIASHITNTPVEVTITADKMVIRDFGRGIEHSKIHQIYLVAGNSTKSHDGNQTGGFGLGCKAPFAYGDHFTVISNFMGTKTVYAMSRGSAKTDGKPDARVMVQVPTTDSGIQVEVPLRSLDDSVLFTKLIKNIAYFGEMNVTLNGDKLPTLPISEAKEGFTITNHSLTQGHDKVFVRYGNVLYPVPVHGDYVHEYAQATKLLAMLNNSAYRLIVQAPPNMISVTPSRESLSLTDTTRTTLKQLLAKIPAAKSNDYDKFAVEYINETIANAWATKQQHTLLGMSSCFKGGVQKGYYNTYREVVRASLDSRYPSDWSFKRLDVLARLRSFVKNRVSNQAVFREMIAGIEQHFKTGSPNNYNYSLPNFWSDFCAKHITGAVVAKMINAEGMQVKNLLYAARRYSYDKTRYLTPGELKPDWGTVCDLLNNTVVITYSKNQYDQYISDLTVELSEVGSISDTRMVYLVSRAKGNRENAVAFFKKLGMTVFDLADYYDTHVLPSLRSEREQEPKKPKLIGIPSVKNLIASKSFDVRGHLVANPIRIENPEWVIRSHNLSGAAHTHQFFAFGDGDMVGHLIVKLWGETGAVCVNSRQMESYIAKGAKDGYQWIGERLLAEFQTNTRLLKYIAFSLAPWEDDKDFVRSVVRRLYRMAAKSKLVQDKFKLPEQLTEEDYQILRIYHYIRAAASDWRRTVPDTIKPSLDAIKKLLDDEGLDPQYTVVKDTIEKSDLFRFLHFSEMAATLDNASVTQKQKDDIESLLFLAL